MNPSAKLLGKLSVLIGLPVLICVFLLSQFSPKAKSAIEEKPTNAINYDIRTDTSELAKQAVASFVEKAGKSVSLIETDRKNTIRAAENLRLNIPNLRLEYSQILQIPEVISTQINLNPEFLTSASGEKRTDILRNFLKQNDELISLDNTQIDSLQTTADYTNPDGNLSYVYLEQVINGIPVFQGELKAGFTKRNELIRIINNLAPNLDYATLSEDFGDSEQAVSNALKFIEDEPITDQIKVEKFYFPIDSGVARTAWRVLLWTKSEAFYVVVDADTGTLLWRKNLTENQTQASTYNVYGNLTSLIKTADSPAPATPGCNNPNNCPQPPIIARQNFTLIGNEPPYTFNNLGWIPDGENRTIGNAVEAGIDRDGINGIDPNGWAFSDVNRNFIFNYNPAPGNPPPGEEPLPSTQTYPPTAFQQGVITHAFYALNRWHDEMYRLGFNELARNFQNDNFGRGGIGGDSISVELQDSSGTNGANFSVPADGGRGRLQLYIWTGTTPSRDGGLDSQTIIHEVTHGLSRRLHGNTLGLGGNMAGGMGEGWSDFYSLAMLSETTDDVNGIYSEGCYSSAGLTNCYYGIRRFPTARISVLGPNGLPHNPLTFRYINSDCNTLIGTTTSNPNSAYPRSPIGALTCDQIHNLGEVWSAALWEMRGVLIDSHGAEEGNRRSLQYITDGMKLAPLNPTMLQERDAILVAAQSADQADVRRVWQGFAARGMGFSARIINAGTGNNNTVVEESFNLPNATITNGFAVSDATGNNNGYLEPGENVLLTVPLTNNSGATVTNVSVQAVGGGSAIYGNIQNGQTVIRNINFTIPFNAPCPGNLTITFNINSSAGLSVETQTAFVGFPSLNQTFSNNTPVTLTDNAPSTPYGTAINVSGISGSSVQVTLEISNISHTFPDDLDFLLVGPGGQKYIFLSDSGGTGDISNLTFTLNDFASTQPSISQWSTGNFLPYNSDANDIFPAPAPSSPFNNAAPVGSATFTSVFGTNGSQLNGEWKLYIVDDANNDSGTMGGWKLTFQQYTCIVCRTCPFLKSRADFDGDGRTDLSVFRPSEGIWYLNTSINGFVGVNWGLSGDQAAPGDFDGDGRADVSVFRPNSDGSQPDFYILKSSNLTLLAVSWGLPNDLPMIKDYDGDGLDDVAVYRPSDGRFYVLRSTNGSVLTSRPFPNGTAMTGDFDGDNKGDFATFNNGQWFISKSSDNYTSGEIRFWGLASDKIVVADYDGDLKDDLAVFRPSDQTWYINGSAGTNIFLQFGLADDIPVPGDYDGDGKADIAVYRNGVWYISRSTSGMLIAQFGLTNDVPIPNRYLP